MSAHQPDAQTQRDLELIMSAVNTEMAKPVDQQDEGLLREYLSIMAAHEAQADMEGTASAAAQQTAAFAPDPADVPVASRAQIPGQGFAQEITPLQKLGSEAMATASRNRMQDIGDFIQRPFMDDAEQMQLATRRKVERSMAKLDFDAKARAAGVDPEALRPAEISGSIAPDLLLSGGPAFAAARSIGGAATRVAAETGLGAVLGGSTVPLEEDPTGAAALGAGLGLGGGVLSELPGAAKDFLRRDLRAAKNSDRDRRVLEISEEAGIDLSLAERTGSPSAGAAELGVQGRPGGPRDIFLAKREEQLVSAFDTAAARLNPEKFSPTQIITKTREAFNTAITGFAKLASERFRQTIAPAVKTVGAKLDDQGRIQGGFKFVQTPNLIQELKVQRQNLSDAVLSPGSEAGIKDLTREIDRLEKGGPLDLGVTQRFLKDLSGRTRPSGITIKDNTKAGDILSLPAVQKAINKDLDDIVAEGGEFGETIAQLQASRREFGQDIADIEVFKNTRMERMLGQVGGDPQSDEFARNVLKLDTTGFKELIGMVDDIDPGLGRSIRAAVLEEMADKTRHFDPLRSSVDGSVLTHDIGGFMAIMNEMPATKFNAFIDLGIPAKDGRFLRNAMLSLQAIAEGPLATGKVTAKGMRERIEQFAINAASQDTGFLARLLAGEFTPGAMERLLFTPEGQIALSRLGNSQVNKALFAQSMNVVVTAMRSDTEATEARSQERQQAAEQAQINERLQRRGLNPLR